MEMMTHIEGPIVDSFYDMSLCSWHNELKPPLPSYNSPAAQGGLPSFSQASHSRLFGADSKVSGYYTNRQQSALDASTNNDARDLSKIVNDGKHASLPEHTAEDPHYDPDIASEITRTQSVLTPRGSESIMNAVTRHMSEWII